MPFRHGKNAELTLNAIVLTSFGDSIDFSVDVDIADTTTFGSAWKSALAGIPGAKLDVVGKYDGTVTTGPSSAIMAIIAAGIAVACIHKPGGTLTGQRTNTFNALVASFSESSPVGGIVTWKASLVTTGAVTTVTQ